MGAFFKLPIPADTGLDEPQDLYEILTPSARSCRIHRVRLSQGVQVSSLMANLTFLRVTGAPTSGSGGSTITPVPVSQLFGSSGLTVERNNTTLLTGGTIETLHNEWCNLVHGTFFDWVPSKEQEIIEVGGAERFVVRFVTDLVTAITISGEVLIEVLG